MNLPPGPAYLLQNLPKLLTPPAATLLLLKLLPAISEVQVPAWGVVLACIFSLPVALYLQVQYEYIRDSRAAAAHGATLPPMVYDKWPGRVGLLGKALDNLRNGYPG